MGDIKGWKWDPDLNELDVDLVDEGHYGMESTVSIDGDKLKEAMGIDRLTADAADLRAKNAKLRRSLNDVLTVCSAMEAYAIGAPLDRTVRRGYRRIRACARGFGDDASKGGRWTAGQPKGDES